MAEDEYREDATQAFLIIKPGTVISKYEILSKLGAGGMGDVYLAQDNKLRRQVALKFLSPGFASDETFSARFIREAQSAAALNHPNVVTIFEVGESDGHIFIAMEYVEGKSLRELIDSGQLTYDTGMAAAVQICEGLGAAHKAKLVHRDIKPLNIIIDAGGRARILDFGLAKAEDDMHLTQAGMTIGTVNYMSPEQGKGEEADYKSDIFSLGIVLYEMFTGQLPFKKGNIPSTIYSIVNDQPEPITKHNSALPAKLQDIIDKTLAKDSSQRYTSVLDLKNDLLQLYEGSRAIPVSAADSNKVALSKVKSLAVLYLRNLGSEEDEFLSYGITEDLIVDLTRIGSVRVASMRSIMKYKDSDAELEEIAARLNVDMILDGSIHKAGNSIRISAQLVDVHSGENLWADRWQESSDNLPQIKQALADGISRALDLGHTVIMQAEIGKPEGRDAGAYENYLKAKYNFDHKKTRSDVDIALGLYSLAIKEEPSLLAAKVGIAEIMIYNGDFTSAKIELESALKVAIERNLRADHADVLRLLAQLNVKQSNWAEAGEYGDKALSLAREMGDLAGEAAALGIMISILQPQAKFDEAILLFDRVLEISRQLDDKEQIAEALKNMGIAYSRKGDYEQALDLYNECLEMARSCENLSLQASCLSNIGNVNYYRSRFDLAFKHYEQALEISVKIGDRALSARQNLNMGLIHLLTGK
ncbi:MAG: protein kinase, partial [Candidatus Zixiibacteriota bacterium]